MVDSNILILAFLLDLAIGDPRWLPHPVRIMGKGISRMESFLRGRFGNGREKTAGIVLVTSIVVPAVIITALAQRMLGSFSSDLFRTIGTIILIYIASTTLALRGLVDSARLVIKAVKDGCMEGARKKLAMIVGRDTCRLSEEGVLRATIETLAENLSDGFMAPLFYLVIGGLPLAIAYKAINTLDSMVGYKNKRYVDFGWAAAKLDDLANYVPARITGGFIVASSFLFRLFIDARRSLSGAGRSLWIMLRDGRNHTSPNSGVPEAAMAGALGVQLGGPSTYDGKLIQKPCIGDIGDGDYRTAADQAITLAAIAAASAVLIAVCILGIRTSW